MTREYRLFIQDILKAISDIDEFIKDTDFEDFCNDEKAKSAIVWQIHVITVASSEERGKSEKQIMVKVVDVFGNDTNKVLGVGV